MPKSNDKLAIKSQINNLVSSVDAITLSIDNDDTNNTILFAKPNDLHLTDETRNNLPSHYEQAFNNKKYKRDVIDL